MKVACVIPTNPSLPYTERFNHLVRASFSPVVDKFIFKEDTDPLAKRGQLIDGCEEAYEFVSGDGFVLILHNDVILESAPLFRCLCDEMKDYRLSLSGPRECDGVNRNKPQWADYVHLSFMLVDPELLGRWWDGVDSWNHSGWTSNGTEYSHFGMDGYAKISWDAMGNIKYLPVVLRTPRIGRSADILYDGAPLANHLWYGSSVEIRGKCKCEGYDLDLVRSWRDAWLSEYEGKYSAADRVYSTDAQ